MKKLFLCAAALLLVAGIVFMIAEIGQEQEWRPGLPLDKELVKIGVIHVSDPAGENSGYAYAHYIGIGQMQMEVGLGDGQIIRKINVSDVDDAATELAIRECVAGGANIIIATSWWHMNVCEKLAGEYPGVIFANAMGIKNNSSNFTNYFGRIYQARYLSGIAAGLRTGTNKIGYVAAMGRENSEVTSGLDAFAMGVESVNPDARIYVRVTHRWLDPAGESKFARDLIAEGCDVIAQHSNTPNPQIEAQRAGVWGVGYNSDMKNEAPDAEIASVVWKWSVYYSHLVRSVIDGSFTTKPYLGDIKDGMVELASLNEALLPPGTADVIASARARILGGFGVFDGVMETNDGQTVGQPGETLPDHTIRREVNWYYRNVVEP